MEEGPDPLPKPSSGISLAHPRRNGDQHSPKPPRVLPDPKRALGDVTEGGIEWVEEPMLFHPVPLGLLPYLIRSISIYSFAVAHHLAAASHLIPATLSLFLSPWIYPQVLYNSVTQQSCLPGQRNPNLSHEGFPSPRTGWGPGPPQGHLCHLTFTVTRHTAKGPHSKNGGECLGDPPPTESALRDVGLCLGMMSQQLYMVIISVPHFSLRVVGIQRTALLRGWGRSKGQKLSASQTEWLC